MISGGIAENLVSSCAEFLDVFEWRSHFALQRGGAAEPDEFATGGGVKVQSLL